MGRTIIQPIGPLYGEAVNGTVFGRPNGSIYVPPSNTISITLADEYIRNSGGNIVVCNSTGTIKRPCLVTVAEAQDISDYIVIEIAIDSDFDTIVASKSLAAGNLNVIQNALIYTAGYTIVDETTYYVRTVLMAGSGVAVATSSTIEVTGMVLS